MLARYKKGIKDCDVGTPNLCVHGADFVRQHRSLILQTYESYANQSAAVLGRYSPIVWLMEPDWYQYSMATQHGGALSQPEMVRIFIEMVSRIKRHLPAAFISLDVSPWVSEIGDWMAPFLAHGSVDYVHTSGGRTTAASDKIRAQEPGNLLTWAELHRVTGRGIIADTGYGVGGKLTAEPALEAAWMDEDNLRDRIADGVVAVTYANPGPGWEGKVRRLRAKLPSTRRCFAGSTSAGPRHGPNASRITHRMPRGIDSPSNHHAHSSLSLGGNKATISNPSHASSRAAPFTGSRLGADDRVAR
jgi:hypothetical protein